MPCARVSRMKPRRTRVGSQPYTSAIPLATPAIFLLMLERFHCVCMCVLFISLSRYRYCVTAYCDRYDAHAAGNVAEDAHHGGTETRRWTELPERRTRLQHVAERPVLRPARVDFVPHALVADVRRETNLRRVRIDRRGVDRVRAVHHHIPGFVVCDQPARLEPLRHVGKILADPAARGHVLVVGADALFGRQLRVLCRELGFHLAADAVRSF